MSSIIIGPIEEPALAPNDCGCSEHRSAPLALNDCMHGRSLGAPPLDALGSGGQGLELLRPHSLLRTLALNDDHHVAFVPSASRIAVLDGEALGLLRRLPLGQAPTLEERRALSDLEQAGLLAAPGQQGLPRPQPSSTLVAWLHITNACNLRCSYCYISKTHDVMAPETARAAVDTLIDAALRHSLPSLLIKYAGGEPTLQLPLIVATHAYAQERAAAQGLALKGGVLSNGTLISAATARTLHDLQLSLMVSLDGLASVNDPQRPTIGGRPSFEAVHEGIINAVEAGLRPTVGVTVTGQSVGGLPDLVSWLLDHDLPFGISLYREHSSSASLAELRLDEQRLIDGLRAAYAVVARRPPPWSLLASLLDRADLSGGHERACAAGHTYMVIDHAGQVASCQMRLDQPVTTISVKDPLSLIRADTSALRNVSVDAKEGCRSCDWRYWCGGGCSVATHRATGRYDVQSPNCRIYQELYPEVVRLEGLRLLRWYGPRATAP